MATEGGITDAGVARLRERIGIPEPHPVPPHYRRPGTDPFRNVSIAYGDANLATNPGAPEPRWTTGNVWGFFDPLKAIHFGSFLTGIDDTPLARQAARLVYRYAIFGDALLGSRHST